MSLINDALKQARKAQQQTPQPLPSSGSQLRPVEPPHQPRLSLGWALPLALAGLALLGLFLVWRVAQSRSQDALASKPEQTASVADPATPVPTAQPTAATVSPSPSPAQPEPAPVNPPPAATPAAPLVVATSPLPSMQAPSNNPAITAVPATTATALTQQQPATNAPPAIEPAKPAPLKLQAILFNPTRPAVMISSKTLFVGDRIGDFRVTQIGRDSATLAGSEQTNVLMLATGQ